MANGAVYMLDTDISSYIMKQSNQAVLDRLLIVSLDDTCISVITKAELLFGVETSPRRRNDEIALNDFLRSVEVKELPEEAADHYAQIRANLKVRGTPIGGNDLLIAAHARALDLILVTNNVREYSRVPGLNVENWTEPKH